MEGPPRFVVLSLVIIMLSITTSTCSAQLTRGFYGKTCPNVEQLVRSAVAQKFQQTFVTAPATLRLFFHDCFVRGCDASILLSSPNNKAEKDNPDDISLAGDGFDTVIKAKAAVDSDPQCRNKVSCADILALATRDVAGGPFYNVELGRRDGRLSTIASVQHHLPHPDFNLNQLNSMFSFNGLSQTDMIALSGAHTIGFSHCNRFSGRIYNFSPRRTIDPTLNLQYAFQLRQMCPLRVDPRIAINMDPVTPQTFDNQYFKNLQQGKGLFTSDEVLFTDARSKATVNLFASNEGAFDSAFVQAITKMGRIGVKTGHQGEIRIDCTRPN
ncbi:peroxidase 16 isoform X2 [Gastrolobium bilobum]|uniref:peroxidase 16 isoform X2 n=1 Tax=Gastrolobium bilobum TaxID=150636 RepID=UPI002AB0A22C|nr:peroxidase 16 isoform X2 [Gastrolobium bilobum]